MLSIGMLVLAAAVLRCAPAATPHRTCVWLAGATPPAFDPDGPPDALRWSIERLLTRGLVEEDSSGAIVPAAAERIEVGPDSLTYTFHLRPGLVFTDGTPCKSAHFRSALEAGLDRNDHATRAWLLAAIRGVDKVRAGRPLPKLGIETPDARTLVLELTRPDPQLTRKLALPGVSDAWSRRVAGDWTVSRGLGPWRLAEIGAGMRFVLVPTTHGAGNAMRTGGARDSIIVRFASGAARVRYLLRAGVPDLTWPLPPNLLDEAVPPGYQRVVRPAVPPRRLLLVMRADVPPTTRLPTRRALVHSLNRDELSTVLAPLGAEPAEGLPGSAGLDFPKLDPEEVRRWMERGKLGRSFHVVMSYDQDGAAAAVARRLQGDWSRQAIYVDLEPLAGKKLSTAFLRGQSQLVLAEGQNLVDDPASDLAVMVMPIRGPAVGSFRTGWRTREFDPWITPGGPHPEFPATNIQLRLEEEMVVLPLVQLPWVWIDRSAGPTPAFHPHFGPSCAPGAGH